MPVTRVKSHVNGGRGEGNLRSKSREDERLMRLLEEILRNVSVRCESERRNVFTPCGSRARLAYRPMSARARTGTALVRDAAIRTERNPRRVGISPGGLKYNPFGLFIFLIVKTNRG